MRIILFLAITALVLSQHGDWRKDHAQGGEGRERGDRPDRGNWEGGPSGRFSHGGGQNGQPGTNMPMIPPGEVSTKPKEPHASSPDASPPSISIDDFDELTPSGPYQINMEGFDCSNVVVLLEVAKEDNNRIGALKRDIDLALEGVQILPNLIKLACQGGLTINTELDKITEIIKGLEKDWDINDPNEKMILEAINDMLIPFANKTLDCPQVSDVVESIQEYFQVLVNDLENWIEELLPNRVIELTEELEDCKQIVSDIQIGNFKKEFASAKAMAVDEVMKVKILYSEHFYEKPVVALSIRGFELANNENPGVFIETEEINTMGFTLAIRVPAKSVLKMIEIDWLATLPERSGIQIQNLHLNKDTDPDLKQIATATGGRIIKNEFKFKNPGQKEIPFVAISGFYFSSGNNMKLDVSVLNQDSEKFDIQIQNQGSSILNDIRLTILTFGSSDRMNKLDFVSSPNNAMASGTGIRNDKQKIKLELPSIVWPGLRAFSFAEGADYRLNQEVYYDSKMVKLAFTTWGNTQVNSAQSSILYSPAKFKDLVTQTGSFKKTYSNTDHVFSASDKEMRIERYSIAFEHEYLEKPTVAVAIRGFDLNVLYPGLAVEAEDITQKGFILKVIVYPGARLEYVEVDWLSTIEKKSEIYIMTMNPDAVNDAELTAIETMPGKRTMTVNWEFPEKVKKPGVLALISGFRYQEKGDMTLDVSIKDISKYDAEIEIGVWSNSQIKSFGLTLLVFHDSSYQGVVGMPSSDTGILTKPGDARSERQSREVGLEKPILFSGLNYIDLVALEYAKRFKVTENVRYTENNLEVEYATNSETIVKEVCLDVFYTVASKSLLE